MLLDGLAQYNRPLEIKFEEMLKLMDQCEHVDKLSYASRLKYKSSDQGSERSSGSESSASASGNGSAGGSASQDGVTLKLAANIFPRSPFSLLSGIIPGKSLLKPTKCSFSLAQPRVTLIEIPS